MVNEILRIEKLSKKIDDKRCLKNIWLTTTAGEIHGVFGLRATERIAFSRIITGQDTIKNGNIFWNGQKLTFPQDADVIAENTVYLGRQFLTSDQIKLSDNLSMLFFKRRLFSKLRVKENICIAENIISKTGLSVCPSTRTGEIDESSRALLELCAAIISGKKVIICDAQYRTILLKIPKNASMIKQLLIDHSSSLILLSDDISLLNDVCSAVTIFRNGFVIKAFNHGELDFNTILKYTRFISSGAYAVSKPLHFESDSTVFSCTNFFMPIKDMYTPISFSVKKGEIVGLCSLNTRWNRSFSQLLSGKPIEYYGKIYRNEIQMDTKRLSRQSTVKNKMISLTDNIGSEYLLENLSLEDNYILSALQKLHNGYLGLISRSLYRHAKRITNNMKGYSINELDFKQRISLITEKIILFHPELLVILNPLDDIDPNQKSYLLDKCLCISKSGTSIILISQDASEIQKACHRMLLIDANGSLNEFEAPLPADYFKYML